MTQPDEERIYEGRSGREFSREEAATMRAAWEAEDVDEHMATDTVPGYRFTVKHDLVIRVRWEEWFKYFDGIEEHRQGFEADPIGFAIDAILEPRHEDDKTEVVSNDVRVEYDASEEAP